VVMNRTKWIWINRGVRCISKKDLCGFSDLILVRIVVRDVIARDEIVPPYLRGDFEP
jgi:hypothetical protein